jgi:hypothetical protein
MKMQSEFHQDEFDPVESADARCYSVSRAAQSYDGKVEAVRGLNLEIRAGVFVRRSFLCLGAAVVSLGLNRKGDCYFKGPQRGPRSPT